MHSEYGEPGSAYILWGIVFAVADKNRAWAVRTLGCQSYTASVILLCSTWPVFGSCGEGIHFLTVQAYANEKLDPAQALSSRSDAADDTAASTSSK